MKKSAKPQKAPSKAPNNFVAKHMFQRGGAHEKPHKAHRKAAKQQLHKQRRNDYLDTAFLLPQAKVCHLLT